MLESLSKGNKVAFVANKKSLTIIQYKKILEFANKLRLNIDFICPTPQEAEVVFFDHNE